MLSRREMLIRAAAAGAAAFAGGRSPVFASPSQPATPVNFAVPDGACDCHTHVFGDARRFPFAAARAYTPESASVEEMRALHGALHTSRVVIVQPSVYGTDNTCTLDGIRQLGSSARGIAVIDDKTPASVLAEMDRAGVRGIRINLATSGQTDPNVGRRRLAAAVAQVRDRKWHVQMYTDLSVIRALRNDLRDLPVPVVFDHFGGAQAAGGVQQDGFDILLYLVRRGKAYVKISAPYRSSTKGPDYADVAPLAQALIAANPQRILWGSDWPHPNSATVAGRTLADIAPFFQIDDGRVFNQLAIWAPKPADRKTILVDNPARLYGF